MSDFPTEEEEFELRYDEEMEMLGLEDTLMNAVEPQPRASQPALIHSQKSILQSPQLSQISFDSTAGAVNRRLFGTPMPTLQGAAKRVASTPFIKNAPAQGSESDPVNALEEVQNIGLNRKRRLEDLFGDIRDIDCYEPSYVDPEAKKMKNEEEKDLEMIEKIIEARKKAKERTNALKKGQMDHLNALHAFKMRNLSYTIPNWPFLPLVRSDGERVYVRCHSSEYEAKHINEINVFCKGFSGLLGQAKEDIWNSAREITVKRLTAAENTKEIANFNEVLSDRIVSHTEHLWVDKYKPRKYMDLLSDESTNRNLLFWLKMWDKVVFGKEFKPNKGTAQAAPYGKLNTFNKTTGRFESNGGWKTRKSRQNLNSDLDDIGRPVQKVALLCGPPGLGKTTLAHVIAKHAGYEVRELNASDDRSVGAFKMALENGTQMSSVLNENKRPNCIILDEIDGAPVQSIDFLLRFISDNVTTKSKKAGAKSQKNILKRPIICICNDIYVPSLRQLRQVAFVVNFPPIDSCRLADRLMDISRKEHLNSDIGTMIALAEKSGNDVRSCISMMQFFNATKKRLTLSDVLNGNFGQKDRHRGLFEVWGAIFQIQRPQKAVEPVPKDNETQLVSMLNMSATTRVRHILEVIHTGGDYTRLMQGVHENYLNQKMPDPNLCGVVEAAQWFCFSDTVQNQINHLQNYTVYPYLQFGFVAWHLLFASLAWPKITFPTKGFEFNQKSTTTKQIFEAFRKGISLNLKGVGSGNVILVDTVPLLKRILSPNLRSVSIQLLNPKERYDLKHTVEVMADLGLGYIQLKSGDGTYQYQMEPNLDAFFSFQGYQGMTLSYFGRQLVAREVDIEKMRRSTPKASAHANPLPDIHKKKKRFEQTSVQSEKTPANHLQFPKPKSRSKSSKEVVSKDFFGRIIANTASCSAQECHTDAIVKSPIWYRYKEGYNNAVRKDIHMNELL